MKKLSFALAAAVLASSPVFADIQPAQDTVAIRVSTAGLNLANPRDVAQLRARVDKAIASACTPRGAYAAFQVADETCSGKMSNQSGQIVASLTRDAQKSQMAEF